MINGLRCTFVLRLGNQKTQVVLKTTDPYSSCADVEQRMFFVDG